MFSIKNLRTFLEILCPEYKGTVLRAKDWHTARRHKMSESLFHILFIKAFY